MEKNHLTANQQFTAGLRVIFAASFILVGLYYELAACAISLALMGLLLWLQRVQKGLSLRWNTAMAAVCLLWLFYLLSSLWGVDTGLSLWGSVKYLPVPLFGLCLTQTDRVGRGRLLSDIPWLGAGMMLLTFVLQYVPALNRSLSVNGRLAGFFQYPNTFACFLLLGIVILLLEKTDRRAAWLPPVCGAVLLFGLLQAGSRTVYLMTIPAVVACLAVRRNWKLVLLATVSGVCGVLLSFLSETLGGMGAADRLVSISAHASTLLGRLLYWKDALPIIETHPFGLGYLGYYLMQGSFQTGVYSVRWVHNDLLQLLLDVGWIPAAVAVSAVIRALCARGNTALRRSVLLVLVAHCMMDFDLEFVSMYFVLLLCLEWEEGKKGRVRLPDGVCLTLVALTVTAGLFFGLTSTLTYVGRHDAASAVYPWNTLSNAKLLTETEDMDELELLADRILAQDDSVALAWDAKALAAYSQGDFGTYITFKRQAIQRNPYSLDEYVDYFEKLTVGVTLYVQAGDAASAKVCLEEIQAIQTMLDEVKERTDPLAWQLDDTPELAMPEEYDVYLEHMAGLF